MLFSQAVKPVLYNFALSGLWCLLFFVPSGAVRLLRGGAVAPWWFPAFYPTTFISVKVKGER